MDKKKETDKDYENKSNKYYTPNYTKQLKNNGNNSTINLNNNQTNYFENDIEYRNLSINKDKDYTNKNFEKSTKKYKNVNNSVVYYENLLKDLQNLLGVNT